MQSELAKMWLAIAARTCHSSRVSNDAGADMELITMHYPPKRLPQELAAAIAAYRGPVTRLRPSLAPVCVPVPRERPQGFTMTELAALAKARLALARARLLTQA